MIGTNAEDFTVRNAKRLENAREHLRAAVAEIEEICAELRPNSILYSVLLGQMVPKIQVLIENSTGKMAISDVLQLLNEADALGSNEVEDTATK